MATSPSKHQMKMSRLWTEGAVGWATGFVASLVIWGVAGLLDVDIQVPAGPGSETLEALTLVPILFATLVPALAAVLLLWLLQRFTARAALVFLVITGGVALVSLTFPFGLDIASGAQVALASMHVVTAVGIIGALSWAARSGVGPVDEDRAA